MKIITNLRQIRKRFKRPVVAIGIFDGVHRGHKRILERIVSKAQSIGGESVVVTFDPHPRALLEEIGCPPLLVSLSHRLKLISDAGVDIACVLNFNKTLARRGASDFVKDILLKKIGAHFVYVGEDFKFGKDKEGDARLLKTLGERYGFLAREVQLFKVNSTIVSSTAIRRLVMGGRLGEASKLLGRPVSIFGTVVKGSRRGRLLGYPTANINPHHEAIPPSGVYAVYAVVGARRYKGVLNIGLRPTFLKKPETSNQKPEAAEIEPTIEAHLSGFNKDIYGKDIVIEFVKKIRNEQRFPNKEKLVQQIRIDERAAHMLL